MKRMTTLLLSAVMLLSLTACGRKNDNVANENMAGSGNTATDQSGNSQGSDNGGAADNDADMGSNYDTPHIDGAETPAEKSGKSAMRKSGDVMTRAADDVMDGMEDMTRGNDWDDMLRNGRVRDTDGKLKDGENALNGRYGVRK